MLKFQSVFIRLMVIMFNQDNAALLTIQLYIMCQAFAEILSEILPFEHRNITMSRGDSVVFTCNISQENPTQIQWTKDRSFFSYAFSQNRTFSNFTSHNIIDVNLPSKLIISSVQHDDAGLYICCLTDSEGQWTIKWNLTVSEKPEANSASWYFLYTLTAVIGLLCVLTSAICLCRARTPDQNPVQEQFQLQSEGEVALSEPQGATDRRTNNKHRNRYMERVNSIYGV